MAFIAYVVMMVVTFRKAPIDGSGWLRTFAAALFPFGTFLNDAWLKRQRV